jgi:hypothetical protein
LPKIAIEFKEQKIGTNTPPGIIYMLDNICNNRGKKATFSPNPLFCPGTVLTCVQKSVSSGKRAGGHGKG